MCWTELSPRHSLLNPPATLRGSFRVIAPFYTEVKRGSERLGNLQINAKPYLLSSGRLLDAFLFRVFVLKRRMLLREVGCLGMGCLFIGSVL